MSKNLTLVPAGESPLEHGSAAPAAFVPPTPLAFSPRTFPSRGSSPSTNLSSTSLSSTSLSGTRLGSSGAAAPFDTVRALSDVLNSPTSGFTLPVGTRVKRPFDAQYWACWFTAVVFPVVMAYLWITR